MMDATKIIEKLSNQIAKLTTDNVILETQLEMVQAELSELKKEEKVEE